MSDTFKIALGQITVEKSSEENLRKCTGWMERASGSGARMIVFPEGVIARNPADSSWSRKHAEPLDGPFVSGILEATRRLPIAVSCTVHVPSGSSDGRVWNIHIVADQGRLLGCYRKLHLYDAFSGLESDNVCPGSEVPPLVEVDGWKLGLMTCYDVRFPELARRLALDGADALLLPAAWVRGSLKESHWEIMARARALENTVYVAALSEISAKNIGCSMVVDPLGVPVARAGAEEALVFAEMSRGVIDRARRALPVLENMRFGRPELKAQ
ncbi:hydrolase [Mesosutterella sp. OilRF-GAM-744-9]|uniref:Hydrolase n=1 Tax=Mesosutterella porci TaxID=2915351 RepID=A0ABS9MMR3_9BURK|nr:nitrilase-related carbon-nitrogen hydrolase [Mesosutterella sp. oilRF-744-WT-GAM-9]MCG5029911.1 hydrolase [Mesosutterella sp. oilRF-744-WT-GAM-9]